jgi:hypothetical protein
LQGWADISPAHGQEHHLGLGGLGDSARRSQRAQFGHVAGKRAGHAPIAEDNVVTHLYTLFSQRLADVAQPDKADGHGSGLEGETNARASKRETAG